MNHSSLDFFQGAHEVNIEVFCVLSFLQMRQDRFVVNSQLYQNYATLTDTALGP